MLISKYLADPAKNSWIKSLEGVKTDIRINFNEMNLKNVNLTDELEEVKAMEKLISNSIIEIKGKNFE